MTKILHIFGDDFAASDYEKVIKEGTISAEELWHLSKTRGWSEWEGEREYFQFNALKFDTIDPKFIEFVYEMQDYDASKAENFYVVGE